MNYNELLELAINAALAGGEDILKVYTTDFYVEIKSDNTPVTLADKRSSETILKMLAPSNFPVVSEEEIISNYSERKLWTHMWLVDPLDGTKEFVKRNGEFSVNIALILNGSPVIGVIYAPVKKTIYFGSKNEGSFKLIFDGALPNKINKQVLDQAQKLPIQSPPLDYTVIASHSNLSREINLHLEKLKNLYGPISLKNIGSSIKQCLVAEGLAHEYPRFGATMEWDTAAGQCILEQSGSSLIDLETGLALNYNKEKLENNYFIAKHHSQN